MPVNSMTLITTPIKAGYYCYKNPQIIQAAAGLGLLTGTLSFSTAIAIVSYFSNADTTVKIAASTLPVLFSAGSKLMPKANNGTTANSVPTKRYEQEEVDDFVILTDPSEQDDEEDKVSSSSHNHSLS